MKNLKHSEKFSDFVIASVAIKSSPEKLFSFLTDIENLSQFFPQIEFKLELKGSLKVGSIYFTRKKGAKNWSTYRVRVLEQNSVMSAELIGKDPLFDALRYEHRFIVEGNKTISHEKVEYKFRFGLVGRFLNYLIGKKLVRKHVLDAHMALREKAEKL